MFSYKSRSHFKEFPHPESNRNLCKLILNYFRKETGGVFTAGAFIRIYTVIYTFEERYISQWQLGFQSRVVSPPFISMRTATLSLSSSASLGHFYLSPLHHIYIGQIMITPQTNSTTKSNKKLLLQRVTSMFYTVII